MSDYYILDENDNLKSVPTIELWSTWFQDNHRTICHDKIKGVRISTIFMGLDHNFGKGKPLLFETMVFGGKRDQYQERYTTKKQAIKGHDKILNELFTKEEIALSRLKK